VKVAKAYRATLLVSLLLIGVAAAPPTASAQSKLTLLGCVSASNRVAAAQGCGTVPGSGGRAIGAGLNGVVALAGGGDANSLYAIGRENSAITQLTTVNSGRGLRFAACLTGNTFIEGSCQAVPGAYANSDQAPIASPTAAAISPDGRWLYLVSGSFHGSVIARFSREPLSGALTYFDCLTGDTEPDPTGVLSCTLIPGADHGGYGSGMSEPTGVLVGNNGRHVYVTSGLDQTLVTFDRDLVSGALTFGGCLSTNRKTTHCRHISIGRWGFEGLSEPMISPDGKYLYAGASRAGIIDTFRIGASGKPTFVGCVGGRGEVSRCSFGRGAISSLDLPTGLAASPDWHYLYATSGYGAIVTLRRNSATGALTPTSCISGNRDDRGVCTLTAVTEPHHGFHPTSPLTGIRRPLVSADGRRLFAPVRTQDALVEFRRDPKSGALNFEGCFTGSLGVARRGVCEPIRGATKNGGASGFSKLTTLAHGPGGLLYAASSADSTVWAIRP
jgi:6-phosphogluconolactonase (cycloisomerase 2 family)